MGSVLARAVKIEDLPELYAISSLVHRENYTALIAQDNYQRFLKRYEPNQSSKRRFVHSLEQKIAKDETYILVATSTSDEITGYILVNRGGNQMTEIGGLFVAPTFQSQGAGSALLEKTIQLFGNKPIDLSVLKANTRAISLYERFGFQQIKQAPDKTFYGAPLIRMRRPALLANASL